MNLQGRHVQTTTATIHKYYQLQHTAHKSKETEALKAAAAAAAAAARRLSLHREQGSSSPSAAAAAATTTAESCLFCV